MDTQAILNALTPEIAEKFRTAIALGRWESGERLTEAQRHTCMQALMVWEHAHLPVEERVGYIHKPAKNNADACDIEHDHHYPNQQPDPNAQYPVKFR